MHPGIGMTVREIDPRRTRPEQGCPPTTNSSPESSKAASTGLTKALAAKPAPIHPKNFRLVIDLIPVVTDMNVF
jgi:hypothetical protein